MIKQILNLRVRARDVEFLICPLALAKYIPYRADIVIDTSAKTPWQKWVHPLAGSYRAQTQGLASAKG